MSAKITPERIEDRVVRHDFTPTERLDLGSELARALGRLRGVEAEFEGVKASFKARIATEESTVETVSTDIQNGFTMRKKKCRVVFRPKDKKKDYYPEIKDDVFDAKAVLTEDMTQDDFQAELFEAEQRFERRAEILLFKDSYLVLGRLSGKWFSALRVKVGAQQVQERLDPSGKKFRTRPEALGATLARLSKWLVEQFGEETAKGFADAIAKVETTQGQLEE